jgi:D-proline reductase (dithiol) PrdB
MAEIADFPLTIRLFLKAYPWRRIDPVPWTSLKKPLAQCKLALISTAAFTLPTQQPFDESIKGGDVSFRETPSDVDPGTLVQSHRSESFDPAGLRADPNIAFPIDRVRELVARGRIGAVNHRHFSFMGSITAPGRLIGDTAPSAARLLAEDQADVALLVPI